MQKFQIHFPKEQFEDLQRRCQDTRLPPDLTNKNWEFGTDITFLHSLIDYWQNDYDWHKKENELNKYPQFMVEIKGLKIHFFYIRSVRQGAMPLLLTHGWPDSFLRYAKLFNLLEDYDLIVPSLPGFAFSSLPTNGFINNAEIAQIWHILMTEILGYRKYVASGGDMGRGVTCYLASRYPDEIKAIHLTDVGLVKELVTASDEQLTPAELNYKIRANQWLHNEAAYINIHSTKPQTLAYALAGSPVGLAGWLVEKYHSWSDWKLLTKDDLCDCLTLYWLTNTGCSSPRVYYGNTWTLPPIDKIRVPVGITNFPKDILPAPREWIEKHYMLVHYSNMKSGGHFTSLEQPQEFAEDLKLFLRKL